MTPNLLSIALAGALTAPVAGDEVLLAPADVGMSEAILRAGAQLFEAAVERDELKGVVLLVARRGRIVLHEAYGWRDEERTLEMRKDSLFRLASNTKPVIAAAVLQLVQAGRLELDDPVCEYLASFDHDAASAITVRQLLSHTSGLRIAPIFLRPSIQMSEEHPDAPSLQVEVARFGEIGPEVEPGTSYSYSNAGFNTLGALIEVVSGQALKEYLGQHLYEPLGMHDSFNHESDADPARMSAVFRPRIEEGLWRVVWEPGDEPDYPFPRASGGMISTAADYAAFCQMVLDGGTFGEERIVSGRLIEAATSPQSRHVYSAQAASAKKSFYGFGWSVGTDGVLSHAGSDGTFAWIDPAQGIVGIVFTQSLGGRNPRRQFMKVVDAACFVER